MVLDLLLVTSCAYFVHEFLMNARCCSWEDQDPCDLSRNRIEALCESNDRVYLKASIRYT
jgi:hypothetical protein